MNIANKNYFGIGLIAVAIVCVWILGMPLWDRVSALSGAIADRQVLFNDRNSILTRIDQLNKQYQARASDINKIGSVVPSVKSSAELVSALEALAQQSGLQLLGLSTSVQAQSGSDLSILFMEISASGNYPALITFLDAAERNIRLLDVITISATQGATGVGQTLLNFDIKANSYFLNLNNQAAAK